MLLKLQGGEKELAILSVGEYREIVDNVEPSGPATWEVD